MENEFRCHTLACGFAHTAAISQNGGLYVWGENQDARLQKLEKGSKNKVKYIKNAFIESPTQIKLVVKNQNLKADTMEEMKQEFLEYKAMDVACGQNSVFVCSMDNDVTFLNNKYDDNIEAKELLLALRKILKKDGTLLDFFGVPLKKEDKKAGYLTKYPTASMAGNLKSEDDFVLADSYLYGVSQDSFRDTMVSEMRTTKIVAQQLIRILAEYIKTNYNLNSFNADSPLYLGDIEDMCLGFKQHNCKLFAFGQLHQAQRAFEVLRDDEEGEQKKEAKSDVKETAMMKKLQQALERENPGYSNPNKIITKPQVIKFPQFTKPIVSVACGFFHTLALTIDYEMFSWGDGSYGALGFNANKEDVTKPTKLEIKNYKDQVFGITQICCGKLHSMCLTQTQNIFSWGEGSMGRLGHGADEEDDQPIPKEIYSLSQRKPIVIAASEGHSAAVTETNQLLTWGHGGYGKLGHGDSIKESSPRLVEDLKHVKIVDVSLGASHTLACDNKGYIWAFGQNKGGKLGIHFSKKDDMEKAQCVPVRISMYKQKYANREPERIKSCKMQQVCAGFNHSMAISRQNQIFTWGYPGRGLLGRIKEFYSEVAIPINDFVHKGQLMKDFRIRQEYTDFVIQYCSDRAALMDVNDKGGNKKQKFTGKSNILHVGAGFANSTLITKAGDVFVMGDNTYGQHGKVEEEPELPEVGQTQEALEHFYKFNQRNITLVQFPSMSPQDKIVNISCGNGHLIAQTNLDGIYGWGRNDEGQIGVGFVTDKLIEPTAVKSLQFNGVHQIVCSDDYSAAVTIFGAVFVTGSLEGGKLGMGKGMKRGFQLEFVQVPNLPQIDYVACGSQHMLAISRFNPQNPDEQTGRTFSWGKNQRGQLGIGNKENQYNPQEIMTAKERFHRVACGINFSIGLSLTNRVYFWGNFKYYLDLDRTKDVEEPLIITSLESVDVIDIAASYKYCVALVENGDMRYWGQFLMSKTDGMTRQQILDAQAKKAKDKKNRKKGEPIVYKIYSEVGKIGGNKFYTEMQQISSSVNHAVSLSRQGEVYSWGYNTVNNRLGLQDQNQERNARGEKGEPTVMKAAEKCVDVRELELHNKHIEEAHAGNGMDHNHDEGDDHGDEDDEEYGEEIDEEEEKGSGVLNEDQPQDEQDAQPIEGQPAGDQANEEAQNKSNNGQQQNGAAKGGKGIKGKGKKGKADPSAKVDHRFTLAFPSEVDYFNEIEQNEYNIRAPKDKKKFVRDLNIFEPNVDFYSLEYIRQCMHVWEEPHPIDIFARYLKSNQGGQDDPIKLLFSTIDLQQQLMDEEGNELDEKTIGVLDANLYQTIRKILLTVHKFTSDQLNVKDTRYKSRTSFEARIEQSPFLLTNKAEPQRLMYCGIQPEILLDKRFLKQIFLLLHLHPCYIANIIKMGNNDKLPTDDQKILIKQLLTGKTRQQTTRCNYLLLHVFEQVLKFELKGKELEDVELFNPDCKLMSVYIFRRIFKSHQSNIDTICCLYAHIVNSVISKFSSDGPSDGLDVEDLVAKQAAKDAAAAKGGKAASKGSTSTPLSRAGNLVKLLEGIMTQILDNSILKEAGQNFQFKRKTMEQLEFLRKQVKFYQDMTKARLSALKRGVNVGNAEEVDEDMDIKLAGLDDEDIKKMYPSLRFSGEVVIMVKILQKHLSNLPFRNDHEEDEVTQEDLIQSNVLGLVFVPQMDKITKNKELFLYPYLSKVKLVNSVDDIFKNIQAINIQNIIHAIQVFFTGKQVFPDKEGKERSVSWAREISARMLKIKKTYKPLILQQFNELGREIDNIRSYVNFENMILHCLEPDNTNICISKKLIGQVVNMIRSNKDAVSIMSPSKNDTLIKLVDKINPASLQKLSALPDHNDQMIMKLKTRIFLAADVETTRGEGTIDQYVRCNDCDAILTEDMAVQNFDENLALKMYELQDKQSMVSYFSQILKSSYKIDYNEILQLKKRGKRIKRERDSEGKKKDAYDGFDFYIRMCAIQAKQDKEYKLGEQIVKFNKRVTQQCSNIKTMKQKTEKKKKELLNEKYVEPVIQGDFDEYIYNEYNAELIRMCEKKMNDRIIQKFQQQLIIKTVKNYLWPKIQYIMNIFKNQLKNQSKALVRNYSYGLSNKDFLHMCDQVQFASSLGQMAKVRDYVGKLGESKALASALKVDAKQRMKGYLSVDVPTLLANETIMAVKLSELETIMPKCHLILIAQDSQALVVEIKLVFREVSKPLCGPEIVLQEQVMMKFNIYPKKLQMERNKVIKQKNLRALSGEDQEPDDNEEDGDKVTPLIFPDNQALEYHPDKFMALLNQMERQTAAYMLTNEEKTDRKDAYKA